MKSKHLSETDIQEYILGESDREMYVIEHLKECRRCKAKTEMYRQLFLLIKAQPKPEFEQKSQPETPDAGEHRKPP